MTSRGVGTPARRSGGWAGPSGVEGVAFAVAVAVIAVLLVWWGVFARRQIVQVAALQAQLVRSTQTDPALIEVALRDVDHRLHRQLVMITGEASVFGVMLLVCVVALFLVARQRRLAGERLEKMLQFTTHELKTPIAGVRALLQSLQLGSIPDEMRGRLIEQGLLETHRLEHLAETTLAFQRARAGQQLRTRRLPTGALVDEVLEHRRHTIGLDDVERRPAPERRVVLADRDAFRVVLENLLDNARKYGGGRVVLEESTSGARWRLSVTDQGVGFAPSEAQRLFEPFERDAAGATTHGSGLGLSISRQLVRDMGGELSADSPGPGGGATFRIELSLAPPAPAGDVDTDQNGEHDGAQATAAPAVGGPVGVAGGRPR
jgi:signal transduction histidine kinase